MDKQKNNTKDTKSKGLTDKELAAKYDTGGEVDFDTAIKKMSEAPSEFNSSKKKSNQTAR